MEHALQVWTAAALLPGNPHHKAHILYGDGGTGKSVFLKTIQAAMGDYAGSARSPAYSRARKTYTQPNCYPSLISAWWCFPNCQEVHCVVTC